MDSLSEAARPIRRFFLIAIPPFDPETSGLIFSLSEVWQMAMPLVNHDAKKIAPEITIRLCFISGSSSNITVVGASGVPHFDRCKLQIIPDPFIRKSERSVKTRDHLRNTEHHLRPKSRREFENVPPVGFYCYFSRPN